MDAVRRTEGPASIALWGSFESDMATNTAVLVEDNLRL